MSRTQVRSLAALRTAQASLVDLIVGPERSRVLVQAPTGAGKTAAALFAANTIRARDPDARIVFLVSRRVMSEGLRSQLDGPFLDVSTKSNLLTAPPSLSQGNVVVTQQALGSIDIQTLLFGVDWDLVVVDEADHLSATGFATVRRLAESPRVHRVLILTSSFLDLPDPLLTELPLTHVDLWQVELEDLSRVGEHPLTVGFVRSEAESHLIERSSAVAKRLIPWIGSDVLDRFHRARESTLFAFQAELLGIVSFLQKRRNAIAHSTTDDMDSTLAPEELAALSRLIPELELLVDDADAVAPESKVETLRRLLEDLRRRGRGPVAVFVRSELSARYLGSTLADTVTRAIALPTEPLVPKDQVDDVATSKGVVVVSDEALSGYDLRRFMVGIHYDYPEIDRIIRERESRIGAIDERRRLTFIALVPPTG